MHRCKGATYRATTTSSAEYCLLEHALKFGRSNQHTTKHDIIGMVNSMPTALCLCESGPQLQHSCSLGRHLSFQLHCICIVTLQLSIALGEQLQIVLEVAFELVELRPQLHLAARGFYQLWEDRAREGVD